MNLILFGIKGCGKTTLGKKVAKKLGRAFIDTDQLIEQTYQMSRNKKLNCREIYQEIGAVGFHSLEQEVVQSLQDVQHSIIAAGGGTMLFMENVEILSQFGKIVYLVESKENLKKRIFSEPTLPPFFDPKDPESSFEKMYEERDTLYRRLGAAEVDLKEISEEEAVSKLCELLQEEKEKDGK